jgi:hypothetical protein
MVYLPPELYSSILGQVTSRRDLCAVTRVSRLLHSESEPLIYRDLDLDHRIRSRTKIAICRRLCTSDVLPLYVQSFTWRWRVDSHFLAFSLLLPRVLSRLTRLRSLSLMLPAATGGVRLFGRYRFKLVILKIICLDERLNDDCLLPFLETQDKLQHLEFGHIAHLNHLILPDRPLPLGFLPNLSVLCAPYVDSVRLISGRSITHLSGWANSDYSSLKALSLSATPLMALVIGVGPNEDGSPRLPMLPDFVPDLEALYLVLQDRSSNDVRVLVGPGFESCPDVHVYRTGYC